MELHGDSYTLEKIQFIKEEKKNKRIKKIKKRALIGIAILCTILSIYSIVNIFFIGIEGIKSDNMKETIKINDMVTVDKRNISISRGHVYKFKKDKENLIARCIGVGGDTIKVENDKVFVNGMLFAENYVSSKINGNVNFEVLVPEGEYFMLGDNRGSSFDSRYWDYKFIPKDDFIGEITSIVYPFSRSKDIKYY